MPEIQDVLLEVLRRKNLEWKIPDLNSVTENSNIFMSVDSFAVVELLLETEEAVEKVVGCYVPLGDESLFDAQKSPLREFSEWVSYVSNVVENHGRE